MANIFENILVDTEYFATYTKTIKYTVTWKDWDGKVLKTEQVKKGVNATPPSQPSRDGYRFDRWNKAYSAITQDIEIQAEYIKTWTVVYKNDGLELKTQIVDSGGTATPPSDPTKEGSVFSGWSHNGVNITSDLEITASFKEVELNLGLETLQVNNINPGQPYVQYIPKDYRLIWLQPHNFWEDMWCERSSTLRANSVKLVVKFGDDIVDISSCKITLEDTENYTFDNKTGVLTRLLGDKFYSSSSYKVDADNITIEYGGITEVYQLCHSYGGIVFTLDWVNQGTSGSNWWRLYPTKLLKKIDYDTIGDELYVSPNDLSQFTPEFYYLDAGGAQIKITYKVVNSKNIYNGQSKCYEVYIPSSAVGIFGEVKLNQTRANGFINEKVTTYYYGVTNPRRGEISTYH